MLDTTLNHLNASPIRQTRTYELLIVDDGSKDDTSALALKLAQRHLESDIRVVTLEKNLGKGGAVRHGMLHARGNRLLMVDADGASRFEDLELLWKSMDELGPNDEPTVVVGSRAHLVKTEAVVKVRLQAVSAVKWLTSHTTPR
jgi:dolichyl-phosphate beta-glucosyltransferase